MVETCGTEPGAIIPVTVQIEITDRCNMRCPMCITSEHRNKPMDAVISPAFIRANILEPIRKRGIQWLSLSGGEPTISPHLIQVIRDARSLDYGIFLATNALSEEFNAFGTILQAIGDSPSAVQVSFDSLHKEEMNRIRGGDYLDKVIVNLARLKSEKVKHGHQTRLLASIVVQEQNAFSFLDTVDYALSRLGFDNVIVQLRHDYRNITPLNKRGQVPITLTPAAHDAILKNGAVLFERAKTDSRITVIGENIKNWTALLTNPSEIDIACKAARRVFVDPYGNLRGCIHSKIIGNLNEITIDEYFESEAYHSFLAFSRTCNICIHGCSR